MFASDTNENKNGRSAVGRPFDLLDGTELEGVDQVREDVTDGRAKQRQDHDHDDGDQNQDERIFYQALAFFAGHIQHDNFSYDLIMVIALATC